MNITKTVHITKDFLLAVPVLLVLSTVFIVNYSLANGVVSGKYFWFYGSMAGMAITTTTAFFIYRKPIRIQITDGLVFFLFLSILLGQYFIPEYIGNTTKYKLLILLFILYGFFRIFLTQCSHSGYALMLFFLLTGLVEAVWGLRQLYGWEASNHHLFKLTGSLLSR